MSNLCRKRCPSSQRRNRASSPWHDVGTVSTSTRPERRPALPLTGERTVPGIAGGELLVPPARGGLPRAPVALRRIARCSRPGAARGTAPTCSPTSPARVVGLDYDDRGRARPARATRAWRRCMATSRTCRCPTARRRRGELPGDRAPLGPGRSSSRECARVLRPGGELLMSAPRTGSRSRPAATPRSTRSTPASSTPPN